jgi:hypothetical protein
MEISYRFNKKTQKMYVKSMLKGKFQIIEFFLKYYLVDKKKNENKI